MRDMRFLPPAILLVLTCAVFAHAQHVGSVQLRAVDALGSAIPKAMIQTWVLPDGYDGDEMTDLTLATTDDEGYFTLPARQANSTQTIIRLLHADYGTAETTYRFEKLVRLPLLKKGSDAEKNALRGAVLDPDNKPVAGAHIHLGLVTTPNGDDIAGAPSEFTRVYTDKHGQFNIYPVPGAATGPGFVQNTEVVLNSSYYITVVQPEYALFHKIGNYKNSNPVVIHLDRPELAHHFVFMGQDGRPLKAGQSSRYVRLSFVEDNGNRTPLPARVRTEPVKLMPGQYEAFYYNKQSNVTYNYAPIEVTKTSPEELVFRLRLPSSVNYVGRVLDGPTGQPLAGAFVMAEEGLGGGQGLTKLTAEDWQALHALPNTPEIGDPVFQAVLKKVLSDAVRSYGLARTDAEGKYSITLDPGNCNHGYFEFIVFDEARLPLCAVAPKPDTDYAEHATAPDASLFPAAKLIFKPIPNNDMSQGDQTPLVFKWQFDKEGQPEWLARFPHVASGEVPDFRNWRFQIKCCSVGLFWKASNEDQMIFVPAGMRVRVQFKSFDDAWVPREHPEVMLLKPGEIKRIEDLTFLPTVKFLVKVVDSRGQPLKGIRVRRRNESRDRWMGRESYTDSSGMAQFNMPPGSKARIGVFDLLFRGAPAEVAAKLEVTAHVKDDAVQADPTVITLTDAQILKLSKLPRACKVPVRVVDSRGRPLKGILVHLIDTSGVDLSGYGNSTNEEGLAEFYLPLGESGRFGIAELLNKTPATQAEELQVTIHVPHDSTPTEPAVISLTDAQIEQLSKPKPVP